MKDKYLLKISAKQIKTGTFIAIIFFLLFFSNHAASCIATCKCDYTQGNTTPSIIIEECPYSDYEMWAYEENFPAALTSAPLDELINAPILLKLVVLPSGEYNKNEASRMLNNLSRIPDSILSKFLVSGQKIKLIQGKLTDEPEYSYLRGVTPRGWEGTGKTWDDLSGLGGYPNVVVKIGCCEKTEGTINLELHETGHAVDCAFYNISKSASFLEIWRLEVSNLFYDTCIFDYVNKYAEEYFAESFAMYFYNNDGKEKLEEQAPLTCELISQLATGNTTRNYKYLE